MEVSNSDIAWNIKTHNKLAQKYELIHGEIYNDYEQSRLTADLRFAIGKIKTKSNTKLALDFGCGAGNLTKHLTNLGADVIAADVSQGFLDLIGSKIYPRKVFTARLNGTDLSNISDDSVDMVATYSVLHHVPDYLAVLEEFVRILKPGGIIFIDHEHSDEYWLKSQTYKEFSSEMKKYTPLNYMKYFVLSNYYDWLIRRFINPRYHREGDIHVFDDDHIEWSKVTKTLLDLGGEVVYSKSYLLFRRNFSVATYDKYKDKTSDMHVLVVRKK
jgi:ubiquinone/menaquinone biosynthesis C-methylase UbiE